MSVYLYVSFNFRHVSAAHGPSSGECLVIGETTALSTSVLSARRRFVHDALLLEYYRSILSRIREDYSITHIQGKPA
jgi:hypothetical protein